MSLLIKSDLIGDGILFKGSLGRLRHLHSFFLSNSIEMSIVNKVRPVFWGDMENTTIGKTTFENILCS